MEMVISQVMNLPAACFSEDQVQETGAVTTNISSSLSENISVNAGFI
jgi:hypothetical protein